VGRDGTPWGRALAPLLLAAGVACGTPAGPPPADPLPRGVHALAGLDPALPPDDLAPFDALVGGARFVALGESTHTSAGFYQAKARLVRHLVERRGFRVLLLETPWLEALPATRYVATCEGTPEAATRSLNGVWRDASVRELLRWMCTHNRAHPADPVHFLGFDVQEPWAGQAHVRAFLERTAPADAERFSAPLRECLGAGFADGAAFGASAQYADWRAGRKDEARHATCVGGLGVLEAWLAEREAALAAASSAAALEEARVALVGLRAFEDQLHLGDPAGYEARDWGMAQSVLRLHALHTPGRRAAVWAWNWHIARDYPSMRGFDDDPAARVPRQGARAMGTFLHEVLGAQDYVPLALTGWRVETNGGLAPPRSGREESVERWLHGLGQEGPGRDVLLVDLRAPVGEGLLAPGTERLLSQEWGDPFRQFAGLLYLEHSPAMQHLP
jgi:erythromycin esterase-like protein